MCILAVCGFRLAHMKYHCQHKTMHSKGRFREAELALGWDTWGSLPEQASRFRLSPEGFCVVQDQQGIPVKKPIRTKAWDGQAYGNLVI